MFRMIKAYRVLVEDDFSPQDALDFLYRMWKMRYFPYRLYTLDVENSFKEDGDFIVYKDRTWNWRGRTLHTKEYKNAS